jgi:hypothetical protein
LSFLAVAVAKEKPATKAGRLSPVNRAWYSLRYFDSVDCGLSDGLTHSVHSRGEGIGMKFVIVALVVAVVGIAASLMMASGVNCKTNPQAATYHIGSMLMAGCR